MTDDMMNLRTLVVPQMCDGQSRGRQGAAGRSAG